MSKLKLIARMTLFGIVLFAYFTSSFILLAIHFFNFHKARPTLTKIVSLTSKLGLIIFNIKVNKVVKNTGSNSKSNFLIVSNHLTYLDILVISSLYPTCFVTSVEMKQTPFLGQLCLLGGCLFVERRTKKNIGTEVEELTNALKNGLNVVVFPEATSTNGESVLNFKRPLFQAALNANINVLPVCLNYKRLSDENISLKNRDDAFWYDSTPFFVHALRLFSHHSVEVELIVRDELQVNNFEDKQSLAEKCHAEVSSMYLPIIK